MEIVINIVFFCYWKMSEHTWFLEQKNDQKKWFFFLVGFPTENSFLDFFCSFYGFENCWNSCGRKFGFEIEMKMGWQMLILWDFNNLANWGEWSGLRERVLGNEASVESIFCVIKWNLRFWGDGDSGFEESLQIFRQKKVWRLNCLWILPKNS